MFLTQLFEAVDKRHAAFAFGRMNPPTLGHKQLVDTVAKAAAGGDYFIFTSQSQDSKKNPLDYATKVKFLQAMMPEHASHFVYDPSLKTIMQIAAWLYAKGYRSVTFVAGSDRLANFKELLEKYNGVEGPNGVYQFDTINFVSSGERDPDEEGLAGVSATAAREAAKAGNLQAFAQATGAGELAKPLYHAVRKGLLVEACWKGYKQYGMKKKGGKQVPNCVPVDEAYEDIDPAELKKMYLDLINKYGKSPEEAHRIVYTRDEKLDEHIVKHGSGYRLVSKKSGKNLGDFKTKAAAKKHEREVQYFKHQANEDANGYIPKNKREAKDPRWSNALSVDVTPETPTKNAKALRLI